MSYSPTTICNQALRLIRHTLIASIDDDNDSVAMVCLDIYQSIYDEVLESYPFKESIRRHVLHPEVSSSSLSSYAPKFLIPIDCLRILRIEEPIGFQREGDYIYCQAQILHLVMIARIPAESLTGRLGRLISLRLACELSSLLLEQSDLTATLQQQYAFNFKRTCVLDANESSGSSFSYSSSWINHH